MQAEGIGGECSRIGGALEPPGLPAILAVGLPRSHLFSPPIACRRAGPCRVFPLGFGRQAVRLATGGTEPFQVLLGIVPAHVARRCIRAAALRKLVAGAGFHAGIPLLHGHLGFSDCERSAQGDLVRRFLARIARIAAHRKRSGRQGNQRGTSRAVLDFGSRRRLAVVGRRRRRSGGGRSGRGLCGRLFGAGRPCGGLFGAGRGSRRFACRLGERRRRRFDHRRALRARRAQAGDARLRQRHEAALRIGFQVSFVIAHVGAVLDRFPKRQLELLGTIFRNDAGKLDVGNAALRHCARRKGGCSQYANDQKFLPHQRLLFSCCVR